MRAVLPGRPAPSDDDVHVVQIALDVEPAALAELAALLSSDERGRAGAFVFDRDRRRFTVARARMRQLLGTYLDVPATALRFDAGPYGKPFVVGGGIEFNLSHSGERALLAVSPRRVVGVDIEQHRLDLDFVGLARHSFSAAEQRELARCRPDQVADAFYRGWARKESFIKARGDGLSFPLDGFDVSLDEDPPRGLLACPAAPADMARWVLVPLAAEAGYTAALTVEGEDVRISRFEVA